MLENLNIKNFRNFQDLQLSKLGRINLITGKNNSGKTSILEAVETLVSVYDPTSLFESMEFRGEVSEALQNKREFLIKNIFHNRNIENQSNIEISSESQKLTISIKNTEVEQDLYQQHSLFPTSETLNFEWSLVSSSVEPLSFLLSENSSVIIDQMDLRRHAQRIDRLGIESKCVQSIGTSSLNSHEMILLFGQIVLEPEEEIVTEALRAIEPSIQQIAIISNESLRFRGQRDGLGVRLEGLPQRISLGSLGDGIWRMLGISLALVSAKGGYLLIDEIDTGLHFSTMKDMWKLISETAKKLNVQVFATTHSSDCWMSLADVVREDESDEIYTIHRIEQDRDQSVMFDNEKIIIAERHDMEIR
jgi:AAA15 family ATPase/GTPase